MLQDKPASMNMFAPAQVVEGVGTAGTVGDVLADQWTIARAPVFFTYDPELEPLAKLVRASLERRDYEVESYTRVKPEPDLVTAQDIARAARRREFAAVVGLGGGSTLDMAKVAAIAAHNDGPVESFIGNDKVSRATAPLVLVPTTAGSGAEASRNAMLSIDGIKQRISSVRIVPSVAILDPTLTLGLPPRVTAASGLDALSHAVESYLSTNATPLTDTVALDAVELVSGNLLDTIAHPRDLAARQRMLEAAYFGGLALNAGAVIGHSIAYTVALRTGLSHGMTTALALPYAVAYNLGAIERRNRLRLLAHALTGDRHACTLSVVEALYGFLTSCGLPSSLKAVGIHHDELPHMVDDCLTHFPRSNNPEPLGREALIALYEHMFEGDPLGMARLPRFAA